MEQIDENKEVSNQHHITIKNISVSNKNNNETHKLLKSLDTFESLMESDVCENFMNNVINNTLTKKNVIEFTTSNIFMNFVEELQDKIEPDVLSKSYSEINKIKNTINNIKKQKQIENNTIENIDNIEECYICGDKLEVENEHKLCCGHKFHLNCIKLSFNSNNSVYGTIHECPYCRKPCYNTNVLYECNAIIKSGKNKGKKCISNSKFGNYCGKHKSQN